MRSPAIGSSPFTQTRAVSSTRAKSGPYDAAQVVEQRAEGPSERGCVAFVVTATGGLARLREQPDADAQRPFSGMSVSGMSVSDMPVPSMFVRAVGIASSRAGSIGSPVTSSTP